MRFYWSQRFFCKLIKTESELMECFQKKECFDSADIGKATRPPRRISIRCASFDVHSVGTKNVLACETLGHKTDLSGLFNAFIGLFQKKSLRKQIILLCFYILHSFKYTQYI